MGLTGFLFLVVFWLLLEWVVLLFGLLSMLDGWDGDGCCIDVDRFWGLRFLSGEFISGYL